MRAFFMCLSLILSGCAITSTAKTGPNGRPVHSIDAMTAGAAYKKAAKLCPDGYQLIGNARLNSGVGHLRIAT